MKLTFFGGARTVTGSRFLVETHAGKRILVDAGLFQGRGPKQKLRNQFPGFEAHTIDAVLLTHAHIDHSGYLPALYKQGFRGEIYCTAATRDLCGIMLPDSGHIQEEDVRFVNSQKRKEGKKELEPLYTVEDAEQVLQQFRVVSLQNTFDLFGLKITYYNAGHLLGSAGVLIEWNRKKLFFTGDVGRAAPKMLWPPDPIPAADYVVCESTYGDRDHPSDNDTLAILLKHIREVCVERKGKLLIPAFSIGRTQEILFALDYLSTHEMLPKIPVYVDSPLSSKGTHIFKKYVQEFNEQLQEYMKHDPHLFDFEHLHYVNSVEESKALNAAAGPCIIISSSGMMEAGRIRHHVFNNVTNPSSGIFITGYCEPGSLGGRLSKKPPYIKLFGEDLPVRARVFTLSGLSAHADRMELHQYLRPALKGGCKQLFLVHGGLAAAETMASEIHEAFPKLSIEIPTFEQTFTL
jgi:metallo-beta-lactamase family protein